MNIQTIKNQLLNDFRNKKILIWGYGREGKSTHKFFENLGEKLDITIADSKENTENVTLPWISTAAYDERFNSFDIIFKSPGIASFNTNLDKSKVTSQTELFFKYYKHQTIGITGTKGKSTTSSLLYHVLSKTFNSVFLVGNIGIPCLNCFFKMQQDSIVVFELSAHQLEIIDHSPYIAVFTNFFQEHLDH